MQGENGVDNQSVNAFFLHAGQAAKHLVGNVLAKSGQAYFIASQFNDAAKTACVVITDFKGCGFRFQNLVAGVADPFNADEFARGGDHAPGEKIVKGCAVFETKRTAGVFRNVSADGRSCFRGWVNRKEEFVFGGFVNGVLSDDSRFAEHGFILHIDFRFGEACHIDNNAAFAGRHGAAGHAGTAAPWNEGEFHFIGKPHQLDDMFDIVGFDH